MQLNPFQIRKLIDIKQIKNQLWTALEDQSLQLKSMNSLMDIMYHQQSLIDKENVSVHSAFICVLHLANEKGLSLMGEQEEGDF